MSGESEECDGLATVRDWLRYAVSRFNAAGLSYGHGTDRALDDAAFLVLAALHLDGGELDPWLEARLTRSERQRVRELIEARIATRKPAPYLVGFGYLRGYRFQVDERAIVPRSYLGELLADRIDESDLGPSPLPEPDAVGRVLDLCTGGGSLAILAALAYPRAAIDAVDLSADALALAAENVDRYELADRIALHQGDLFAPLRGTRFDLIVSNPPYVTDAAVAAFPPEHRAEPDMAHRAGADGLDLVRRLLAAAGSHLTETGRLVVEVGTGRDALEATYPHVPFLWHDTESSAAEVFSLEASDLKFAPSPSAKSKPRRRS